jgi:hypothetical protein
MFGEDHWKSLTSTEQEAVRRYKASDEDTGDHSAYKLNADLRAQHLLSDQQKHQVDQLDTAIRFPSKEPMTLFRAMGGASVFTSMKLCHSWGNRGYMSACADWRRIASHLAAAEDPAHGGAIVTIRIPHGIPMLFVDSNPAFGRSEYEYLLPRGLVVKLISKSDGSLDNYAGARFAGSLTEISIEVIRVATKAELSR